MASTPVTLWMKMGDTLIEEYFQRWPLTGRQGCPGCLSYRGICIASTLLATLYGLFGEVFTGSWGEADAYNGKALPYPFFTGNISTTHQTTTSLIQPMFPISELFPQQECTSPQRHTSNPYLVAKPRPTATLPTDRSIL